MKKSIKRPVSVLLTLLMFFSLFTVAPLTANAETSGDWTYMVQQGQAGITAYGGISASVTVPSELDNYPVMAIVEGTFTGNTVITDVTIPDGITYLGANVFEGCTNLSDVTIYGSAQCLQMAYMSGINLFSTCNNVTLHGTADSFAATYATAVGCGFEPIASSETLTSGDWTYEIQNDNASITAYGGTDADVTVPSELDGYTVTRIGDGAFAGNTSLINVTLPLSVTTLSSGVFADCSNLESVTYLNPAVSLADPTVFSNCGSLTTFYGYIDSSAEQYAQYLGFDFEVLDDIETYGDWKYAVKDNKALIYSYNGTDSGVAIPSELGGNPVTAVLSDAFKNNTSITRITIPASVSRIKSSAFAGCTNLIAARIHNNDCDFANNGTVFSGCNNLTIYCGAESNASHYASTYSIPFKSFSDFEYTVEDNRATITAYVGTDTEVVIPSSIDGYSVESIGENAFKNYTEITSVTVPKSVSSISDGAFSGCPELTICGYVSFSAESYASSKNIPFTPIVYTNTGSGYVDAPLYSSQTRDDTDSSFSLSQNEYQNIELLGVQRKTDKGTNDMRFVAVINEGILKDDDIADYGFVAAKTDYTSTAGASENYIKKVKLGAANTVTRSCVNTDNTYSGSYGIKSADTKYKYVTLAVKDVPENQGFVARFYVETTNGKVYYANYKNGFSGCVTSFSNLQTLIS